MNYENEIPEYALQPAKVPEVVAGKGLYDMEEIFGPGDTIRSIYHLEEDVLVPDVKPDMEEILMIKGDCTLTPKEKDVAPKTDDLINLTGDLKLQLVYKCYEEEERLVAINTRIPYKYQWNINPARACTGKFGCQVKSLDYEIINERKFRISAEIEFSIVYFYINKYGFFTGLEDENLEVKEESIPFTSLIVEKEDFVEVDEIFSVADRDVIPTEILCQDFIITENYRQVTGEKIVINGFIYCNLFYEGVLVNGDEEEKVLKQHSKRIEFTQFIPIEKDKRGKKWACMIIEFFKKNLMATISVSEEKDHNFHIRGIVETKIRLYEGHKKKVIIDAYHLDRNFQCTLEEKRLFNIVNLTPSETSVREIVSLPNESKIKEIKYVTGGVSKCEAYCDKGRTNVEGEFSCQLIWEDKESRYHKHVELMGFHGTIESAEIESNYNANCKAVLKSIWCDLINENQLEINGQIMIFGHIRLDKMLRIPTNPGFLINTAENERYPMTIAVVSQETSIWEIAKKYKTTCEQIKTVNHIDEDTISNKRILIVR